MTKKKRGGNGDPCIKIDLFLWQAAVGMWGEGGEANLSGFFFVFLCVSVDFGMQLSGFTLEAVGSTLVFEQTQWFLFNFFFFFLYIVCVLGVTQLPGET